MVRITQTLLNDRALLFLQQNMSLVARLQEQLSTGHRINRPADDPVDFPISLNLRSSIQQSRNYQQNVSDSRTNLELTENSMQSLTEVLQSLRTLAVQGASDIDVDARLSLAEQVAQQYGYILDLANTNLSGQSIFAGGQTQKKAFTNYEDTVLYQGDDFEKQAALSRSTYITTNLNGYQTFLHTPNQITGSICISDPTAPLAEQLRLANPNFPLLPALPQTVAGISADGSPNPQNSPSSLPNNLAEFTIYGKTVRVDLSVDSLVDLKDHINASVPDVTASINSNNQLVITSKRGDALDLQDGAHDTGFPSQPPNQSNILSALGMHRRIESQRSLNRGYPAADPLTDGTASPAPPRGQVRVQNDSFLFVNANTGPADTDAVPLGDNLALTNLDKNHQEALTASGDPDFLRGLESIRITLNDQVIDLDLSALTGGADFDGVAGSEDDVPGSTMGDLLDLINNHPALQGKVTAFINADQTGISLSAVNSADVFKVENVRKLYGADLTTHVSVDSATGRATVTKTDPLTLNTKLSDLPGALVDAAGNSLGIRQKEEQPAGLPPTLNLGIITIENNGSTDAVDLRSATTIGDVIDAINNSKVGVKAEINASKTGINIESLVGSSEKLSVFDMGDGTTAKDLGLFTSPTPQRIQSTTAVTASDTVAGLSPASSDGNFTVEVRDRSGQVMETYTIAVSTTDTLADIAKKIDEADGAAGPGGGLISANLADGRLNIVSNYNGHKIRIDSSQDTTGSDALSRVTSRLGIDQYTTLSETQAATLSPYASQQNTAAVLGIQNEGKVNEIVGKNVFLSVKNLERALRNDDTEAIQQAIEDLDTDLNKILNARTIVGARLNRLTSTETRLKNDEDQLKERLSTIEDVDLAKVIVEYITAQNVYNSSLAATGKIMQQSLLDFLS